jgi:ParB family chromosome partitioning protein
LEPSRFDAETILDLEAKMNEDLSRKRLGRGLAALIGEIDRPEAPEKPAMSADGKAPIEFLSPNPKNPRRHFGDVELNDLAQSIREHGVVQPVVARPSPTQPGRFEIIAGERRWRAAQRAGLAEIPVIIREVNDRTALELAIIENVQRADLNAVEEAQGYQQLIDEHGYTQADLGQVIGKSRSHVANTLRLLKLPDGVRAMVVDGALSAGHARTLVTVDDPIGLARRIVEQGLSVRQAEALAQMPADGAANRPRPAASPEQKDADTLALEKMITNTLGMITTIEQKGKGGSLRIAYRSLEQLDEISRRLMRE